MAKKKSVAKIIAVQLIRSFLVVVAMLVTGIVSYKATMTYYEVVADNTEDDRMLDIVGDVTADAVSRNIIYSVDDTTKKITGMVIEVLNMGTGNLDYITVPAHTQLSLGADLYTRLTSSGIDVPQIVNMADINLYFKEGASYEYGILMLEDAIGIDIGYYTCMSRDVFDECFEADEDSGMFRLTDSVIRGASEAAAGGDMEGYIKTWCSRFASNISARTKLKYAESYMNIVPEYIYYHMMKGEMAGATFIPDADECKGQYQAILKNNTYSAPQSDVPDISSVGLNIKVLNGSGGNNIASATKGILAENGLNVVKIADNPDGIIEDTVIYVAKDGMGRDLLRYFSSPSIEVKEMEEGIDIIVVVGASDINIGNDGG